jgi:hypothetical protein
MACTYSANSPESFKPCMVCKTELPMRVCAGIARYCVVARFTSK